MSRRRLAALLGTPDSTAGIPVSRRVRAGLFERLVHAEAFASRIVTRTVGDLSLKRPTAVHRVDCGERTDRTSAALQAAHERALDGAATILVRLGLPFPGMEDDDRATFIKPDFALVASRHDGDEIVGSWLIMGDAKDYERVRSQIADTRMLKGFLQVALGAEAAERWSVRPAAMEVHSHGALAVPRNAFLQPTTVVEDLTDHREEVRERAEERAQLVEELGEVPLSEMDAIEWVRHREARFDPATCTSCSLFGFCRSELRASDRPEDLLIEIGVPEERRSNAVGIVDGDGPSGVLPQPVHGQVTATVTGEPVWLAAGRIDPVGLPGTIEVVLAKSDSAATGIHGVSIRSTSAGGSGDWRRRVFADTQSPTTRLAVLEMLGEALGEAFEASGRKDDSEDCSPVHLVVPDSVTSDVLVSIADSAAGVELSRLRWQRDVDEGRPALTYDGEPAVIPDPLTSAQRLAVSFLLDDDRARTMTLRQPIVNLTRTLARHVAVGGSIFESGRLDYLLEWTDATEPVDHRAVSDKIAASQHTPGARLSNATSDAIHDRSSRGEHPDPIAYRSLVEEELAYKESLVERARTVLEDRVPVSSIRAIHRLVESDCQTVWWRRWTFGASDLVRFGRTPAWWRDRHVDILDSHDNAASLLDLLGSATAAAQAADDAGTRHVRRATIVAVDPVRVDADFRRLKDPKRRVVAVAVSGSPAIADPAVQTTVNKGSVKFANLSLAPLEEDDQTEEDGSFGWEPTKEPSTPFAVGDELILVDYSAFPELASAKHEVKVDRPKADDAMAPKPTCGPDDHAFDPEAHRWCCQPHTAREAATSDHFAQERAEGRMNPETWPPLVDEDAFDVAVPGAPTADDIPTDGLIADDEDDGLTADDLD